jgi:hypothetical protein
MNNLGKLGVSALIALLVSLPLSAQATGDLRGTITDPSGAAVPGAKITLSSTETGETRTTTSDAEGRYAFNLLKAGAYAVTVEADGFRRTTGTGNVLTAQLVTLDLRVEVGQVTEQVVVADAVSKLDTQTSQVQESFQTKQVAEIPVARNPNLLVQTLPGIAPNFSNQNSGSFFANGNRSRSNHISIDGVTAVDISVAGTGSTNNGPLNFSAIREVKVITNGFSAEYGRNSGSQVMYITKSGTNEWHGEAYEYLRNNFFNARDFFDTTGKPTVNRYNQFGGVLGGPIIKNKTHFFVSAEGNPLRGSGAARTAQVPTPAMVAQVTDPTSRALLQRYNIPTSASGQIQQNASNRNDFRQWSVRVDHQFSEKDTVYARVGTASNNGTSSANTFINSNLAGFGLDSTNTIWSANLNYTRVFSPTVINEFRAGFGRTSPIFTLQGPAPQGPRVIFQNAEIASFGDSELGPQGRIQNTFQYGDTVTWTTGAHNIKIGGDFFRYQLNSFADFNTRGVYTFADWNAFAIGQPTRYQQQFGASLRGHRTWLQSAFIQDDYRVTPTLTLNLGFRAEVYGPVNEVNGLQSNLRFDCNEPLGQLGTGPFGCFTVGGNAIGTNPYFQPRIGFAWNPGSGKTVIRGGYGLVADFNFLNSITNQRALPPLIANPTLDSAALFAGANSFANLVAGTALIQQQGLNQVGQFPNQVNYGDVNPVIDPDLKNPQVHNWSLGVQRELPGEVVLKVSYIGTKANFLTRARQINLTTNRPRPATSLQDEAARQPEFVQYFQGLTGTATRPAANRIDPRFNIINYIDNSANSNFHSLQVFATRAFKNGFSLNGSYTYAKSIDDVSDQLTASPGDSVIIQNPENTRENRSVSIFDLKHRVTFTHVYELPFGRNLSNGFLRRLVYGYGFSGFSTWRSGFPVSFIAGGRGTGANAINNIALVTTAGLIRPNSSGPFDFNPKPAGSADQPTGVVNQGLNNISAYAASLGLSQPLLGNFGNLGRNTHRLNGQTNFDWNVYKNTQITERVRLQLRCEVYNVFNNVSFEAVQNNISSPQFGQYTTVAQGARFLQLGATITF